MQLPTMGRDQEASQAILDNLRDINDSANQGGAEVDPDGGGAEVTTGENIGGGEKDDEGVQLLNEDGPEAKETVTEFNVLDDFNTVRVEYAPDFHKNFDYVIVFPLEVKMGYGYELTRESIEITLQLKKLGAILFPYLSVQKDELIVLLRFPKDVLREFAHKSEFLLPLDPVVAEDMCAEGDKERLIAPIFIPYDEDNDPYHPFLYIYGRYDKSVPEELYYTRPDEEDPFHKIIRIKLTRNLIEGRTGLGGGGLLLSRLINKEVVLGAFPLHDPLVRKKLLSRSIQPLSFPWDIPFAELNDYFGEKLTLYFVFLSTYSLCLRLPALLGFAVQYLVFTSGNYSHYSVAFLAVYISYWSLNFTDNIEQVEDVQSMRWGTWKIHGELQERGEYVGKEVQSPITGRFFIEGDPIEKKKSYKNSFVCMTMACLMSLGVVCAIYLYRYYLYHVDEVPEAGIDSQEVGEDQPGGDKSLNSKLALQYASCVNAVQIQIFNVLFTEVAIRLTESENHRTEAAFESHLVSKMFAFLAVNSFASFIYIGYMFPFELELDIFYNYGFDPPNVTYVDPYNNTAMANGTYFPSSMPTGQPTAQPTAAPSFSDPNQTAVNASEPICLTPPDCRPQYRTGFREGYDANHLMYVAVNWTTLFVMKHMIIIFTDLVIPWFYYIRTVRSKRVGTELPPTEAEKDFMLHPYRETENSLTTYGDAAIFFGCYVLFGTAVPMASFLVFVQNWAKVKTDMWRHMLLFQRPHPSVVSHSGSWKTVFDITAYFAVLSNAATICFSMNTIEDLDYSIYDRFWIFIGMQWLIFSIHYVVKSTRKSVNTVRNQLQRSDFVVSKLIDKKTDMDYYHLTGEIEKADEFDENDPLLQEDIDTSDMNKAQSDGSADTNEEDAIVIMKYPIKPTTMTDGAGDIELLEDKW